MPCSYLISGELHATFTKSIFSKNACTGLHFISYFPASDTADVCAIRQLNALGFMWITFPYFHLRCHSSPLCIKMAITNIKLPIKCYILIYH